MERFLLITALFLTLSLSATTAPCPAGKECDGSGNVVGSCSVGYYSPLGDTACTAAPPGFVPTADQGSIQSCPIATPYSDPSAGVLCQACPAAYAQDKAQSCRVLASPNPRSNSIRCRFLTRHRACGDSLCGYGIYYDGASCQTCLAGEFCPGDSGEHYPCPSGTYSANGAGSCNVCDAGNECPSPASAPTPCADGYYSLGGLTACIKCPAGYACANKAAMPSACSSPDYAPAGSTACSHCSGGTFCDHPYNAPQQCPEGSYCPDNSVAAQPCGAGTYSAAGASSCTTCEPGFKCPTTLASDRVSCNTGEYSAGSETTCHTCEAGYKCPTTSASDRVSCNTGEYSTGSETTCHTCEAGFKCPTTLASNRVACNLGEYSAGSETTCHTCEAGFKCPTTSALDRVACDPGYYSTGGETACHPCEEGFACPTGNAIDKIACTAAGTYSAAQATACKPCDPGYYCTSHIPSGKLPCPAGSYCPEGATASTLCTTPGTYSNATAAQCTSCEAGYRCTTNLASGRFACTGGTYSLGGTTVCTNCPGRRACTSSTLGANCPAGTYLPATTYGDPCTTCPEGSYCPASSLAPIVCTGTAIYSASGAGTCSTCEPGYYCPDNLASHRHACAAGQYSVGGTISCTACPGGKECTATGLGAVCTGGTYALPNVYTSPCNTCPGGRPCSANSLGTNCVAGTHILPGVYQTVCDGCPEGTYCPTGCTGPIACDVVGTYSAVNASTCTTCEAGYACPTFKAADRFTCSGGKYSLGGATTCTTCPGAKRCVYNSLGGDCPAGTYLPAGAYSWPCYTCTRGYYCVGATTTQTICQSGYYSNDGASSCTQCEQNYYCTSTSISNRYACPGGSYSLPGSSTCYSCPAGRWCDPVNTASQGYCPTGFYSPVNTFYCLPSPPGYTPNALLADVVACSAATPYSNVFESVTTCVACPAGYKCNGGTITRCPLGQYSAAGSTTCTDCPAGSICPDLVNIVPCLGKGPGATDIVCDITPDEICDPGYYLDTGDCVACPAGQYCPGSPATAQDCLPGWYSTGTAATCTVCPAGKECPTPSSTPTDCASGYYSFAGFANCVQCPAGYSCATKTAAPVMCGVGYYALAGSTACTQCPAGSSCEDPAVAPVDCADGYYAAAQSTGCRPCPGGAPCSKSAGVGTACTAGRFVLPLTNAAACNVCTPGKYCPHIAGDELPCPTGTYSAAGATTCTSCEPGYMCPTTVSTDKLPCDAGMYSYEAATSCSTCPDGYSCPSTATASPTKCTAGTYSSADRRSCTACEDTFACPNGFSAARYSCPTGRVSAASASVCSAIPDKSYCTTTKAADVVTCGAGQYLVGASCVSAVAGYYYIDAYTPPKPCPSGWYAAAGATSCTICPAGSVCPNTDGTGIYTCAAGTYSTIGTYTSCTDCPKGRVCPATNKPLQKECDAGYYAPNIQMTACIQCPVNKQCLDKKNAVACPQHYYSLLGWGVCRPCPSGQTCTVTPPQDCGVGYYSLEADENCYQCPRGYYCPLARNSQPNMCLAGTFSGSLGASSCSTCPSGTFSVPGATSCTACPAGSYCPDQARPPIICPLGTYSTGSATACTNCDDGYVCLPGSTSQAPASDKCPRGYYCNHGTASTILQIVPCPVGTYGVIDGGLSSATGCQNCPIGYYCPLKGTVSPISCPKGTVCEVEGLTTPNDCVEGTYNPSVGGSHLSDCLTCPGGNYCPTGTYEPRPCPPGYYCPPGTAMYSTKCPAGTYSALKPSGTPGECMDCPTGSYCELGAMTPTYCPPGTYNALTNQVSLAACLKCAAGTACPKYANTQADNGIPCPPGYYCPEGTQYPTQYPCPNGTYSNDYSLTADTQCVDCPKGYACLNGTNRYNNQMLKCAPGYYCPVKTTTTTQFPCAGGYYQPYPGADDISACTIFKCPPGQYCPPGSAKPAGICPDGYYCSEGSDNNATTPCPAGTYSTGPGLKAATECTPCPPGYYCLQNSTVATINKCPAGKYNPYYGKTQASDCLSCDEGYYCPIEAGIAMLECGLGNYSGPSATSCTICPSASYCNQTTTKKSDIDGGTWTCLEGFLCPQGVGEFPIDSLRCPKGMYCPAGSVYPITCPPGTYNPKRGAKTAADCLLVPAGYYASRAADVPEGDCAPGYYCPIGSTRAQMIPCPAKTFRSRPNGESLSDCGPCPAGYYCLIATVTPIACPVGFYCLPSTDTPLKCPKGYFGSSPMLRDVSQCTECWSGRYCSQDGLAIPDGRCDPGYYCAKRAIVPNPVDGVTGNLCPRGAVCPQGSVTGQPCLPGTYSKYAGLTSYSACSSCTAGSYCIGEVKDGVSGTCKAGYYCPAGSYSPMQNAAVPGYYSPAGSGGQTACPGGQYTENYGSASCNSCPSGYYCSGPGNTGVFTSCPPGYYCPVGYGGPAGCPKGTFNPVYGLKDISQCMQCKAGYYCPEFTSGQPPALAAPYDQCRYQYYCPLGSIYWTQTACPTGHYCETGAVVPTPCPLGTFNVNSYGYYAGYCGACTAGYYCGSTGLSAPSGLCDEGYYCPAGQTSPRPTAYYCDVGQYCPKGAGVATPCPAGKYQNSKKQADCMRCPKGYYCPQGSVTFDVGQDCPPGYYCPEGTGSPIACPAGTYNKYSNAFDISMCLDCEPGYYCPGTGRVDMDYSLKCAGGYYCVRKASTSSPMDGVTGYRCGIGNYCPPGSSFPTPCTPGWYCNSYYLSSPAGSCPAGYYCPIGATTYTGCPAGTYCEGGNAYAIPCPPGTYRTSSYATLKSQCLKCPDGYYCPNPGQQTYSLQCSAGFYCQKSADMNTGFITATPANRICPRGYYCGTGYSAAQPCDSYTYQDVIGQSSCKPCPAGYWCDADERHLCTPALEKPSYYCPYNRRAKYSCSDGYYNVLAGTSVSSDCLLCPAGYYCPTSPGATEEKINTCPAGRYCPAGSGNNQGYICPAGYYCPAGSATYTPCPPGKYCPSTGISDPSPPAYNCTAGYYCSGASSSPAPAWCPAGNYCPAGAPEPIACPPGTFRSGVGGVDKDSCTQCTAGKYCKIRGSTSVYSSCPAGYYCPEGTAQSNRVPCEPGYRCPPGRADHELCPDNTYQPLPVQSGCLNCPARYYCKNTNADDAQKPKICPPGKYCGGVTQPIDCPVGTYNPREGIAYSSECDSCPPGKICDTTGISNPTKLCTAGYYCSLGAYQDPPADSSTTGGCPIGHYCPAGSVAPTPCPPGTYNDLTKKSSLSDCLPCPLSYFCPYRGGYSSRYRIGIDNTFKCAAGYLCILGSPTATPTDGTKGKKCDAGKYCAAGATAEIDCPAGTYNPYTAQSSCLSCPPGRLCPDSGMAAYSTCPVGKYCPGGTSVASPCPAGTYNPNINIISSSECYPCDPGMYCLEGVSVPSGTCSDGYVCARGSAHPFSTILYSYATNAEGQCPPGSYCLAGAKAPTPCPVGTYQDEYGKTSCKSCPQNYYCPKTGMSNPTSYPCANGYICTGGATTATPMDASEGGRPCNEGNYCIISGGITVEIPCPAGTYEPRKASGGCQDCPAGFYCPPALSAPIQCPTAHYCEPKSITPKKCPDGTYSNVQGLQRLDQCRPCPSGEYCVDGVRKGSCNAGYYCVSGAKIPNDPAMLCPPGAYCLTGSTKPTVCPTGKVRLLPGATTESDCTSCSVGYYCLSGSPTPLACPKGHYCPLETPVPIPCPRGYYQEFELKTSISDCMPCPPGYYCAEEGLAYLESVKCPPGHYCNDSTSLPYDCPPATYFNDTGGVNITDCKVCPEGFYCEEATITPQICEEGSYCPAGSIAPTDCPPKYFCRYANSGGRTIPKRQPCPGGYYCPLNTIDPIRCENGYYCRPMSDKPTACPSGTTGAYSVLNDDISTGCTVCQPGTYSSSGTDTAKCLPCAAGYVCLMGATTATPVDKDIDKGYECPKGYYCPEGSYEPTACPLGTFNNKLKGTSVSSCMPCESGTYNNMEGQSGCRSCGPSSTSKPGSESCECYGKNRVFHMSTGKCLCKQFHTSVQYGDTEDSKKDCRPLLMERCATGYLRDTFGKCVSPNDCTKECKGKPGKRTPGIGICECSEITDPDAFCNASCRAQAPVLTITQSGQISTASGEYNGTDSIKATTTVMGEPKCPSGGCKMFSFTMEPTGGFSSDYQPSKNLKKIIAKSSRLLSSDPTRAKRFLAESTSTGKVVNPAICLKVGDSVTFDIGSAEHYPTYLKDAMANSNPNFDYSAFMNLENRIKSGEVPEVFIFTFNQPGVYVFADKADQTQMSIFSVMSKTEKCPSSDKFIVPITADTLTKMGVKQSEDITLTPDWVFIGSCFVVILILIPGVVICISYLYNNGKKAQKSLASIGFAKQQPVPLSTDRVALLNTNVRNTNILDATDDPLRRDQKSVLDIKTGKDEENEVDPGIFEEIYKQLKDHAAYVKEEFEKKADADKENIAKIWDNMKDLKRMIKQKLKDIAKIFGKNIKYLLSEKKKPGKSQEAVVLKAAAEEHKEEEAVESEETEGENDMDHIIEVIEAKNGEDMKELARIQEQEDERLKEFMQKYVEDQSHRLETFKEKVLENAGISETDKQELLKQYETQLQDLQKALIIGQKEQQQQLKIRLDARKNHRGQLAAQLDKLNSQRKELVRMIDNQLLDVDMKTKAEEKRINEDAAAEKAAIEQDVETRKAEALKKQHAILDKKLKKVSDPRKRTEALEQFERDTKEIAKIFEQEKKNMLDKLLADLNVRVKTQLDAVKENSTQETTALKEQRKTQLDRIRDIELIIMNKLGNVAIDEKVTEAVETDRMKAREDEAKFEAEKEAYARKLEESHTTEKEKLAKVRDEFAKDEDMIKEDYEVQKRIITNAIKKKSDDLQKQKEKYTKQLKNGLLTEDEEFAIKSQIKSLDEQLVKRIEEEVSKQDQIFQNKLKEKKRLKSQREADIKETSANARAMVEKEWLEKEQTLRGKLRKDRLARTIEELKARTKGEELPIAVESVIEDIHMEELTDLLGKQYREKAYALSDNIGNLIQNKLIEINKVKEEMELQFQKLKESYEKNVITHADYERRLKDLQSRENDRLRDIELQYIQKQNDMERALCGSLAEKQEQELVTLRETQWKEKRAIISDIALFVSASNSGKQAQIQSILGGGDMDRNIKEIEEYKEQLRQLREKRLAELDERRMRLQTIAIENEEAIKRFNEGTKQMLDKLSQREHEREEKRKTDIEKLKKEHEGKVKMQEGITEADKAKLLEEYNETLEKLSVQMATEQKRQATKMMEKLEKRLKEKDQIKAQKQIQLATYRKEVGEKMEQQIKDSQVKIEAKVEVKDLKLKVTALVEKYDNEKTLFDKKRRLEGVENIDELAQIDNMALLRDKEPEDEIGGILAGIDFDGLYEKIGMMEERVGIFTEEQFHKLVEGFRVINSTLNELKEKASAQRKKYQF